MYFFTKQPLFILLLFVCFWGAFLSRIFIGTLQKKKRNARQSIGGLRVFMLNFNYFDEYDFIDSLCKGTLWCQSLKIIHLLYVFFFFSFNISGFNTRGRRPCFKEDVNVTSS